MAQGSQRKRCVDCRRTYNGTAGRPQWCPDCGGEMRPAIYGRKVRKPARGR